MKIIITGGNGQLGKDCQKALSSSNRVFPFGSNELDITSKKLTAAILQDIKPDVIINCAAYTAVDKCESNQEKCMLVNATGPAILAKEAAKINARLIHISTDYVFDGKKSIQESYKETDQVSPLSFYGRSKLAGEKQIRENIDNHLIIRTSWLYGIDGNNFLKTMLRLTSNNHEKTFKVVNDQFGSLTWTFRLAQQIEHLLDKNLQGTIHATAEGKSTWFEGATFFLKSLKVPFSLEPCSTKEYPTPAIRPANSILENEILKKNGLNIMRNWKDDVKKFIDIFQDKLKK